MKPTRPRVSPRARLSAFLADAEQVVNGLSESESDSWPFGFLRPSPGERMSSARVALLSILYALPAVLLTVLLGQAAGERLRGEEVASLVAAVCLAFFALYRATFAFFWNRRAEALEKQIARRKTWQAGGSAASDG